MQLQYLIKFAIVLLLFFGVNLSIKAQTIATDIISDSYVSVDETSSEELWNLIEYYLENPLVWNSCTEYEIEELPLNNSLKEMLIDSKNRNKIYNNWKSFQKDLGISKREMEIISAFIILEERKVETGSILSYISIKGNQSEKDLSKSLVRSRWDYPSGWFVGAITEADQGEPHACDYYNLTFRSPVIRTDLELIGGAFRLHWGHGLLFTTNLMNSRSSDAIRNIMPKNERIQNYLGSDENRYFFGSAIKFQTGKWKLFPFYSNHNLDATITDGIVSALKTDGAHRSESQVAAKDALAEQVIGIGSLFDLEHIKIGGLFFNSDYSYPLKFLEFGKSLSGVSLFHKFDYEGLTFTGEFAYLNPGDWAVIQSGVIKMGAVSIGVSSRYFSPEFHPLMGYPMKKYSGYPSNEKGFYMGMNVRFKSGWRFSSYTDFYSRIRSKVVGVPIPKGNDVFVGVSRNFRGGHNVDVKLKRCIKWQESSSDPIEKKYQLKGKLKYYLLNDFFITTRLSYILVKKDEYFNKGMAFSVSTNIKINSMSVFTMGTTQFYSDGFDSRVYLFEPGIPFTFNMMPLYGTGYRFFIVARKRFNEIFEGSMAGKFQSRRNIDENNWIKTTSVEVQMLVDL
ncbi:MAG: hypothetical protein DRP89_00925 [Candidatus Neomarinimicrobiota bacterium]|nr:MAG: hypothetical protein DRP89_00925 [Candidatus Neomarinimicrobiota bacterium]